MKEVTNRFIDVYNYLMNNNYITNPSDFSKKVGISTSMMNEILKGRSNAGIKVIQNTVKEFDFINTEYIITGIGEIVKTKSEENLTLLIGEKKGEEKGEKPKVKKNSPNESVANSVAPSVANQKYKKGNTNEDEAKVYPLYNEQEYNSVMRKIKFADGVNLANNGAPYYPIPVTAGNTEQLLQEEEKPTGFISIPGIYCKAYFPVVGFSFEPLIRAGDVIGIDFIDRWERLDPDSIYFIITENQRMIKRLSDDPENPDRLICISPNFKEFPIWKDEIRVIHKVIFYGRLV